MAFLLLVAGLETTVSLIGNGVLSLLRHPGQLRLLRSDPVAAAGRDRGVPRATRGRSRGHVRFSTEPVRAGATTIPADALVLISLLAANRDRDRFADPHALDITRPAPRSPGFRARHRTTARARRWPGSRGRSRSAGC